MDYGFLDGAYAFSHPNTSMYFRGGRNRRGEKGAPGEKQTRAASSPVGETSAAKRKTLLEVATGT